MSVSDVLHWSRPGPGPEGWSPNGGPVIDQPNPKRRTSREQLLEFFGSLVASAALVWIVFGLLDINAPFGEALCMFALFVLIYGILCTQRHGVIIAKDRLATVFIWAGASVAIVILVGVISYVVIKGFSAVFDRFPHFLTADMLALGGSNKITDVGVGAAIVGTIEQVAIATILTVPLGIMTATYLADNNGPFARVVSAVVDAMTGAPAIIAGLFVYLLWVLPHHTAGKSGFAAALALAVMMLPIVTRAAQEVVSIVPGSLREAALALGAPEWRVLLRVVLPTARAGLMTAVIIGIARIAGETAPILFNAGGSPRYNWNPFSGQQDDLPFRIFENINQASAVAVQAAWGTSLVLVFVVLILFIIARRLGRSSPTRGLVPRALTPWRMRPSAMEDDEL